ncbi:hypothetical protein ILUMI_14502 [Ignelater luminosus]|uniref:Uncharacterized protein n=1 Tax=Ignelater luminosus TaxID=2038154 RepID=A0A8K0CUS8_IGNLU|nr:hypothetical protein ILUMI_14502 [Ignelater luminosus]
MLKTEKGSIEELVQKFLFRYRSTPLVNGKTPAELYFGRTLRTKLHMLKPAPPGNKPEPPEIKLRKLGNIHHEVKLDSGYTLKGHIDQLRSTENATQVENSTPEKEIQSRIQKPERRVTFQLPPVLVPAEQTPEEVEVRRSQRTRRPVQCLNL